MLGEIGGHDIRRQTNQPLIRGFFPSHQAHHGRLAAAILTDEPDPFPAFDGESNAG